MRNGFLFGGPGCSAGSFCAWTMNSRFPFRMRDSLAVVVVLAGAVWPAIALAQAGNALSEIEALRGEDYLKTAQIRVLREWLEAQARVLLSEDTDLETKRAMRLMFQDAVTKNPPATNNFKNNFAESALFVFAKHLKDGEDTGAMTMAMILHDLRFFLPKMSLGEEAFLGGLSHPAPAVKYWIARTIRLQHQAIAELASVRGKVIEALRQAGIAETNGQALREIYRALDFGGTLGDVEFAGQALRALVAIFEVRGERYALTKVAPSTGDLAAIQAVARLGDLINTQRDDRARYVTALSRMLCGGVNQYALLLEDREAADRNNRMLIRTILLLTQGIEAELARLVEAAGGDARNLPSVFNRMRNGERDLMLIERNKWCGWPGSDPGVLNKAPFNVPLGGGIEELKKKPTTTTQAAPEAS